MSKDKRYSKNRVKKDVQMYITDDAKVKFDKILAYKKKDSFKKVYGKDLASEIINSYYNEYFKI